MTERTANVEVSENRQFVRRHVLLKALLDTGKYEFDCMAYDLSVKGARLKLDLPLKTRCEVRVLVKQSSMIPAEVAWAKDGFIGVEFTMPVKEVKQLLDDLGVKLPHTGDIV
ncbi:PilZ domain-containing protein [Paremcibacter congregatus]|uniref:PilZ domain-containing protein n=1 Tax=Paremcibacter congregatus TaxID=2043170 RepID=A0A2G4YTC9_9PROT|nr:PilZ domain-containing protein [Paremcibacter congregatus]PHZ85588.1 hypothetical protein CRD36_02540 [Paremcibacter congregatus]QDE26547.1 PilZ domain-containing protein [Paremcibacter congregatus]|tara:strand:- start:1672 stop:2007 length:336 start_codon:yes stop_codon:yes gene_type:complete